jgi:hypothetical protein
MMQHLNVLKLPDSMPCLLVIVPVHLKPMKPLHHHVQRLAQRFLDAELVEDPEEAQRVVRKAEKHQRKINRWHQLLSPLQNAWRSKL